jgi:hypothetical protein
MTIKGKEDDKRRGWLPKGGASLFLLLFQLRI